MFEKHFGLRENPFTSGHQMRFLYPSREHQEARAHLRYGIENREPFVLITGEVGTGKTTALYDALAEWGAHVSVALITNSSLTRQELVEEIGLRFGLTVPPGTTKPHAIAMLERHLNAVRARGEHAVLLIDEAQNLAGDLLEEIRLLSNLEVQGDKLVQIFLVGQPELEAMLARPELRQLRQRIGVHYRLNPLSPEETTAYVHHRIAVAGGDPWATFPADTCRELYRVTHGIPREINTIASQALIAAFSETAKTVNPAHVQAVARENEFTSVLGAPATMPEPANPADAAAEEREARTLEAAAAGAPETAAPAPAPPLVTPAAEAPPAWTPPELGDEDAHTGSARGRDAWTTAAQDLLDARRRAAVAASNAAAAPQPESAAEADETDEFVEAGGAAWAAAPEMPEPAAEAAGAAAHAGAPRFPTPDELHARAASARPDEADLSGLSERLREKIAADIAAEERHEALKHRALPATLAAVACIAIAVAAVLLQRFQVIDVPMLRGIAGTPRSEHAIVPAPAAPQAPVAVASDSAAHDSLAAAHDTGGASRAAGGAVTASTHALAPAVVTPAAKPAAPAAAAPLPGAAIARIDSTAVIFGLGVGTYADKAQAEQERARIATASGLPTMLVPFHGGGAGGYRVLVGNYRSNAAAERAAGIVKARLGVAEATPFIIWKGSAAK